MLFPLADRRSAVQYQPLAPKDAAQERGQRRRRLTKLRKYQHLLLLRGDDLRDLPQTSELAAVAFRPAAIAQPLGGVIAQLLEAHEVFEHHAFALDVFLRTVQGLLQLLHRTLVQRRLRGT